MNGFFQTSDVATARPISTLAPECGKCNLFRTCRTPKLPITGNGQRKILIIGEHSTENTDGSETLFDHESRKQLEESLAKFGVDLSNDCWLTAAAICSPGYGKKLNVKAVDYCRANVIKAITELQPTTIILLGPLAVKSVLAWLWKEDVGNPSRWDGWLIPSQRLNAWVCATWHPAYLLRTDYGNQKQNDLRRLFFEKHLQAAFQLEGRPWKRIPDYKKQIQKVYCDDEAAAIVHAIMQENLPTAFDYETDRLKPEPDDSRIVCCAVSNGRTTVAYPWIGKAVDATKALLVSDVPKIASNAQFEHRWTGKHLGIEVNNWYWDTMIAAHVMDNRPSISGLKFQAFVLLGAESYDDKIKPFLRAKSSNEANRVTEVDLGQLLEYCGHDALLEVKVAKIQKQQMEVMT